ncbi:MAG: hypothetical protein IJ684_06100, partial [Bacteroidales bacterium]|nr:hypothetical protein [Bacteroidales bacterium]
DGQAGRVPPVAEKPTTGNGHVCNTSQVVAGWASRKGTTRRGETHDGQQKHVQHVAGTYRTGKQEGNLPSRRNPRRATAACATRRRRRKDG